MNVVTESKLNNTSDNNIAGMLSEVNPELCNLDEYFDNSEQAESIDKSQLEVITPEVQILDKHRDEWVDGSGVPVKHTSLAIESVSDPKRIADLIGWDAYYGSPGYIIRSVNPRTGRPMGERFLQFKPDIPIQFPDREKPAKYITSKAADYDAFCLPHPDKNYWPNVIANITQPVGIGEGVKKSDCLIGNDIIPSIALPGVTMWQKKLPGEQLLVSNLRPFAVPGRPFVLHFDMDMYSNPKVANQLKQLAKLLIKIGCDVRVGDWPSEYKGIDDLFVAKGIDAVRDAITNSLPYEKWEKQFNDSASKESKTAKKPPKPSRVARAIFEQYGEKLKWNTIAQSWYRYEASQDGIWDKVELIFIHQLVQTYLRTMGLGDDFGSDYRNSIEQILRADLAVKNWDEAQGLTPLANGVYNWETKTLEHHNPGYHLTWCLPFAFNPLAQCPLIEAWLATSVNGKEDIKQLLLCFLNAIVKGRSDLQQFLELIGPGGTGKSTFIRLAQALIGINNNFNTELKHLESNRFETSGIFGKKLVSITDSERYGGNVTVLKALTGEDTVRNERKFIQNDSSGFIYEGMVLMAANEQVQSAEYTSGLQRRRITVPFTNKIAREHQKSLISFKRGKPDGMFVPELPGLFNVVIAIADETVTEYLKDTDHKVPSLNESKTESLLGTNPLAGWLDRCLSLDPTAKTYVGIAKKDKSKDSRNTYQDTDKWLYANYREYMDGSGNQSIGVHRFSNLLHDLLANQLNQKVIKGRDNKGTYFIGLAIKDDFDVPSILDEVWDTTGILQEQLAKVSVQVTDEVTVETIGSDDCDGRDGLLQVQPSKNIFEDISPQPQNLPSLDVQKSITSINPISDETLNLSPDTSLVLTLSEPALDPEFDLVTWGIEQLNALTSLEDAIALTNANRVLPEDQKEPRRQALKEAHKLIDKEQATRVNGWFVQTKQLETTSTPERPDFSQYPNKRVPGKKFLSDKEARANKVNRLMVNAQTVEGFGKLLKQCDRTEINWVRANCFTPEERKNFEAWVKQCNIDL